MIDLVYYNEYVRCYRDGRVERKMKGGGVKGRKMGEWYNCDFNQKDYFRISIDGRLILVHRLISFCFNGLRDAIGIQYDDVIDHINRNRHDNRAENLRVVSNQQNAFNKNAKGYFYKKQNKKWCAQIKTNGNCSYLGLYDTAQEAHDAYLVAKEIHHII